MSCDADWTQIVYDNASQFQNVIDGNGNIEDKYNGDYKSGNIKPGDVLEIANGVNPETQKYRDKIRGFENKNKGYQEQVKSIYNRQEQDKKFYDILSQYEDNWEDGKSGGRSGLGQYHQRKDGTSLGTLKKDIEKNNDSIEYYYEKLNKLDN